MHPDIEQRAAKIRLLICDVDGVLTDGRLYFGPEGESLKVFHAHDGVGLKMLSKNHIETALISARDSPMVYLRAQELSINHVYTGVANKIDTFDALLKALNLTDCQVAYIGDDTPDLPLIKRAGLGIAVANAHSSIKEQAVWQTVHKGGRGAVREVCDLILTAQKQK